MNFVNNLTNSAFVLSFICLGIFSTCVSGFNIKLNPLLFVDLSWNNQNQTGISKPVVFNYPPTQLDLNERFKLIQTDAKNSNYAMFGARNRIVVVFKNPYQYGSPMQVYESYFPSQGSSFKNRNCSDRTCANYILTTLPLNKSKYNIMICGTYYGLFQCLQAEQNKKTGLIDSYDDSESLLKAPKSINLPMSNENAVHLSFHAATSDYVLYSASSWTDTSQYLSAHVSDNNYQDDGLSKKIGVSKSFVKFVEANDRLFLFQNELSYDIDDGEKDRDIMISTSLVTQICKNDDEIVSRDAMPFYSELTAKIYCFNDAFRSSGNSRMFKFDSLDHVTDLIRLSTANITRKLFYGVFNTPKNQITGTAICMFDLDDLSHVFQKQNFKFLDDNNEKSAKNTPLNPQECPKLTYMEKLKYKSFTSKLSYMTKSALPVRKRKASFMTTNDYRITCLFVLGDGGTLPAINRLKSLLHMNVIYAGTDNGKLLRIIHHFSDDFFNNENANEEKVEIIEEIQLFDKHTKINQITLLNDANNGMPEKLVINSDQQIKVVSIDFCEFHSESCETCLKLNQMSTTFRTKCMWRNGTCKTAPPTTSPVMLENCDYLKPPPPPPPTPPSTTTTTTTTTTSTTTTTTELVVTSRNTTNHRRRVSSSSSSSNEVADVAAMNEFGNDIDDYHHHNNKLVVLNASSSPLFFGDLLKINNNGNANLDSIDDDWRKMFNGSFTDVDRSAYKSGKLESSQQSNELVLFVAISLTASLCMLILGILIGYALKARYSKVIMKKFESLVRRSPFNKSNKPSSSAPATSSVIGASSAVTLSTIDTTNGSNASNMRKFNPYQYATRQQENSSLLYGSVNNKTSSSSSSSSSRSSSECCSRQNSNASNSSKDSNGGGHHNSVKLMKSKNLITREYFTVQNDYGLMPVSSGGGGTFTSRHYLKPPPPIAPPQIPSSTLQQQQQQQQHRLSSTSSATTESSSASPTSTSSYSAVAYNLINSQTCLLNGVVAGSSVSSQPPLSSKQSNTISSSEVASETTTSTHISPVSRLVLSTTTTDSSYPAAEGQNGQNCIVVNDDDEDDDDDEQERDHENFTSSSAASSNKPSPNSSSTLSQNPSNRSTSSAASSSNWASLTRISHHNRYYKQQQQPQHYHHNHHHHHLAKTNIQQSPTTTRDYYTTAPRSSAAAPLASAESPTSGIYTVKNRLASLLNNELLSSSSSPSAPSSAGLKIDDVFLNNSYV